jgi:hypothetical protein
MPVRSLHDVISTNGGQQIAPMNPRHGGEYGRNISGRPSGENFALHGLLQSRNLPGAVQRTAQQWMSSDIVQGAVMTDPTREEIDAKLTIVELRTENRFNELSGKIDRVGDAINALTSAVTTVRTEVKEDGKFTRWTVGVTLIASLIAFGAALWVTQGNMLSAFQAGLLLKSEQVAPSPSAPRTPSTR